MHSKQWNGNQSAGHCVFEILLILISYAVIYFHEKVIQLFM